MAKRCEAGELVVEWLEKHGHTQAWLARELGVANSVLWRWLSGSNVPRVDFALALQRITGVSASLWVTKQRAA